MWLFPTWILLTTKLTHRCYAVKFWRILLECHWTFKRSWERTLSLTNQTLHKSPSRIPQILTIRKNFINYSLTGDQWGHPALESWVRIELGSPQPSPLLVTPRCLILTLSWAKTTHARNWIHNQTHFQWSQNWRHFIRIRPNSIMSRDIYINKKGKAKSEWEFHKLLWFYQRLWGWLATGHGQRRVANIWTQLFRIFPEQRESRVDKLIVCDEHRQRWWSAAALHRAVSLASIRLSILWVATRDPGLVTTDWVLKWKSNINNINSTLLFVKYMECNIL
mgnify:CR=1 FL=1